MISKATMISSLRISAVKEIATMFRNSFSKSTSEMIMIAAPGNCEHVIKTIYRDEPANLDRG